MTGPFRSALDKDNKFAARACVRGAKSQATNEWEWPRLSPCGGSDLEDEDEAGKDVGNAEEDLVVSFRHAPLLPLGPAFRLLQPPGTLLRLGTSKEGQGARQMMPRP